MALPLVSVPIHRAHTAGELIRLIDDNRPKVLHDKPKAPYVIHLDVSDTVTEASSILLFELIVLGSLYDNESGRRWFLGKNVSLFIEAAPAVAGLPVFQCVERENLVVNASTFRYDYDSLSLGMRGEFSSPRHDGLAYNNGQKAVTAHHRLRWVSYALALVNNKHELDDGDFLTPMPDTFELDEKAFHIICHAAGLDEPVSLWSLWGFVDVAFWSLASAFSYQNSPLLEVFRNHGLTEKQTHLLSMLRAECFDFICRTSSDFATRQKRMAGDEYDWLRITETNYAEDGSGVVGTRRHYYKRSQFCSYGQPVFRMGGYLDPTYVMCTKEDGWVITNSNWSNPTLTGKAWRDGNTTLQCELMMGGDVKKEQPTLHAKACQEDNAIERVSDEALGDLKSWNEANHEAMLVSSGALAVLGINAHALRKRMHPELLEFLEKSGVDVGAMRVSHQNVLASLTNVQRSPQEAARLLGGTYCMTRDVVLKMLAVFIRVRCGVPVILMGECGCGKTHMLRYVCAWLGAELLILDVHGGTTEEDIIGIFDEAQKKLKNTRADVYVFLDEVNTCPHMGLIAEIIVGRSIHGQPLAKNSRIHVLAACNPYRRKRVRDDVVSVGLAYQAPKRSDLQFSDGMEDLVYRVHPIPKRLLEYVFDFGSLSDAVEAKYIRSMVEVYIPGNPEAQSFVTKWLIEAQTYIREVEGDPSVVSLRDLKRALKLCKWFSKYGAGKAVDERNKAATPALLGILHVFYFRLANDDHRSTFIAGLRKHVRPKMTTEQRYCTKTGTWASGYEGTGFSFLYPEGAIERVLQGLMRSLCGKLEVESGIAMNQALRENLYVTMICIFNRMPTFVVGKPGTSKTLTLQVLANNLKGEQSTSPFWQRFPALYMFPYQCSPLSTAAGIRHQFDIACSYQKKSTKTIVVLLLDEVGLAEHSPDMPLKVLHGILVDPPIAIVGLSNWTLDAAKMNRAVCLQRPEPATKDIHLTGEHILGLGEQDREFLRTLAVSYHAVYTGQTGREFIGMRDYYYMIKLLRTEMTHLKAANCVFPGMQFASNSDEFPEKILTLVSIEEEQVVFLETETRIASLVLSGHIAHERLVPFRVLSKGQLNHRLAGHVDPLDATMDHETLKNDALTRRRRREGWPISGAMLAYVLMRNFGGHERVIDAVVKQFGTTCYENPADLVAHCLPPLRLISANLNDATSRHLMVLTENGAALPLLFETNMLDPARTDVLVGSTFRDDAHELHLIQQVNKVKAAMAAGRIVILHNHDSIYESLYDVLNQRYVTSANAAGRVKRMLRLAIGSRSQLCPVEDGFKIVVVAEKQHAHENLDLPLLNRFEKQYLSYRECLTADQLEACTKLEDWIRGVQGETTFSDPAHVFCGFNTNTVPSLVFSHAGAAPEELRAVLAEIALPIAVMQSASLSDALPSYMDNHTGLVRLLSQALELRGDEAAKGGSKMCLVITHSPVEQVKVSDSDFGMPWTTMRLAEMASEASVRYGFGKFFEREGSGVVAVQCDPMSSPQQTIDHARRIAESMAREWQTSNEDPTVQKHVVFIVHTPPGAKNKNRSFSVVFSNLWSLYFIDDVSDDDASTLPFLSKPITELIEDATIDLEALVRKRVHTAVSLLKEPQGLSTSFTKKMRIIGDLVDSANGDRRFVEYVIDVVRRIFAKHCTVGGSGLHHQVELAVGALSAGSLKVSIHFVIEYLVVQAVSHVLRHTDVNNNLAALSRRTADLWFALLKKMDSGEVIDGAVLDGVPTVQEVPNTGKFNPLSAKFPFSFRLMEIHEKAKEPLMSQAHVNYTALAATCEQLHGKAITDAWKAFAGEDHVAYYQDLVGSKAYCPPGVEWPVVLAAYEIVLRASEPDSFHNPLALHVAFWRNEQRMLYLCSLLASLRPEDQHTVVQSAKAAPASAMNATLVESAISSTVQHLRGVASAHTWAHWVQQVYPHLLLDVKALGSDTTHLDLIAMFAMHVLVPNAVELLQPQEPRQYFVDALVRMKLDIASLRALFDNAPTATPQDSKDALLVTFLDTFVLPRHEADGGLSEAELLDVIRLCCGLRPKFWPGAEPMTDSRKRSLLNAFITHKSFPTVLRLAASLKMGPKSQKALFHALLEYAEDTAQRREMLAEDFTSREVSLLVNLDESTPLFNRAVIDALVKARLQVVAYATSLKETYLSLDRSGPRKPGDFPAAPPSSLNLKKVLETQGGSKLAARALVATNGLDMVMNVMQMGKPCNWFWRFDRSVAENAIGDEVVPNTTAFVSSYTDIDAVVAPFTDAAENGDAEWAKVESILRSTNVPEDLKLIGMWSTMFSLTQVKFRGGQVKKLFEHFLVLPFTDKLQPAVRLLEKANWYPYPSTWWDFEPKAKKNIGPTVLPSIKMLLIHLALMLPELEGSFLWNLANNPVKTKNDFWPAHPGEELDVISVMAKYEYLTWYRCPKGHLYSIGECGGAMEVGKCSHPGCNAAIGGRSHASLPGNTRVGSAETAAGTSSGKSTEIRGISTDSNIDDVMRSSRKRMKPTVVAAMRFWMYAALLIGTLRPQGGQQVSLLNPRLSTRWLQTSLLYMYTAIAARNEHLTPTDLLLGMHTQCDEVRELWMAAKDFQKRHTVEYFEEDFGRAVDKTLRQGNKFIEAKARALGVGAKETLFMCVAPQELQAVVRSPFAMPDGLGHVFRFSPEVSVAEFKKNFSSGANAQVYPLLGAVCEMESRLNFVKYLAAMLELQQILFEAVHTEGLTREQAAELSTIDVINTKVREADRARARAALDGYCALFNSAMPFLENLYECTANPFLNAEGHVDIGGGGGLTPDAPLAFMLPSMVPGQVDPTGMSSIQLGGLVHRTHNRILNQLSSVLPGAAEGDAGGAVRRTVTLTQTTPPEIVRRVLIEYNKDTDLVPLLYKHKVVSEGGFCGYDFDALQRELAAKMLQGKVAVQLNLRHFQYAGETRQRGGLAALNNLEQASGLPSVIEAALAQEMTTQQQLRLLFRLLEDATNFAAAVGADLAPATRLATFYTDVMGMDAERLPGLLSKAVCEHGELRHLKALFLYVEGLMSGGSTFDKVPSKYTAPLLDDLEAEVKRAVGFLHVANTMAALRDLLLGPLSDPEVKFPPTECLKDYIGYQDMDIGNADWFEEHFPEDLTLGHAVGTFELLQELVQRQ
eukprot:TRINITY_DN2709_c0_g1_i1.p1 TRINITY_DN2709_c0_g1~~TRINITY_DN2709_c0_g1_i1.p1  ORF type:complete len:3358 (+),score=963.91 TRINITY_DN2709_c0_g1_i1:646-10074(+)